MQNGSIGHDASVAELEQRLQVELKIRNGAENLLQVFNESPSQSDSAEQQRLRHQVAQELHDAQDKISLLQDLINQKQPVAQQAEPATNAWSSQLPEETQFLILEHIQLLQEAKDASEQLRSLQIVNNVLDKGPAMAALIRVKDIVAALVPLLGDAASKEVRSTAHKTVRLCLLDAEIVAELEAFHLSWYLIKSLTRDHKFDLEKQQSLLTVRHLLQLTHTSGTPLVSVGLVRAVVALAENGEDRLRLACLETLAELVVRDVELLASADGLRVLLQVLADGPHELAPSITMVFLNLIDRPHLRAFLRPDVDLEIALAGITELGAAVTEKQLGTASGQAAEERMRSSGRLVTLMLRSWSGLLYLASGERRALKSLIGALSTPSILAKEIAMDTFFEIFRIKPPDWSNPSVAGKGLTLFRRPVVPKPSDSNSRSRENSSGMANRVNLIDHYLCLILVIFVEVGILEALVTITESDNFKLSRRAALLIGELLQLASRVLPSAHSAHVQALPRLFSLAASFDNLASRLSASAALAGVDSIHRNRVRLLSIVEPAQKRSPSDSLEDAGNTSATIRLQVENSKMRLGYQIDDLSFRNQIIESGVLANITGSSNSVAINTWNVDVIVDLLEGALLNPRRLEEVIRGTKWMRRLVSFYHPFERKYSDMAKSTMNARYLKLGITLITTLLSTQEGIRFLAEDKLLKQIADALAMLDPLTQAALMSEEVLFSRKRFQDTMSGTYLELLAIFTKFEDGYRLLARFKIFTLLYHLTDLQSREDLTIGFIERCSYHIDGHTRNILSKVLTSSYPVYRFLATQFLETLLQQQIESSMDYEWIIRLLITQIYDPASVVRDSAVRIIEHACQDSQGVLESLVSMRPELDHLGYDGAPLLFRFLSSSVGVQYLDEIGYIERGLEEWFTERNDIYAIQLEVQLSKLFSLPDASNDVSDAVAGALPFHFYGELVKTEEGQRILEASGHFKSFAAFIREFGLEDQDLQIVQKLKSVLWVVGNIGASEGGLMFLDLEGIIPNIVEIAEDSLCYSIRGTCFFTLGLIASTEQGTEILQDLGWAVASGAHGLPSGLCVPLELERLLWSPDVQREQGSNFKSLPPPSSHAERHLLTAVQNLANHLLANAASRNLIKIKSQQPDLFLTPDMHYRVLHILENIHFRLPVRRYVLDLFEVKFDALSLDQIARAGKFIQETDEFAPIPLERVLSSASINGKRLTNHQGWRSGQSELMREGMSMTDQESVMDDQDDVLPKETLEPIVLIKGFWMY